MNDKPEIEIKIFGGTNMIAPAGATAVQNFYGDQFAEVAIRPEETEGIESLNDAECLLFTYVPDVKKVHEYTRLLGECATAHDLAGVVSIMLSEPRVGKDTVVKGTFIEVLLPFASRLTSGAKVDNVRQQINDRAYSVDLQAMNVTSIIKIGIAFSGKRTRIAAERQNIE